MRLNPSALKEIRERTGLSRAATADAAGIDRTNYSRIESGQRKATTTQCIDIAAALVVPLSAIATTETGAA